MTYINFLIESSPLPESKYLLNDLGLTIGIFKDYKLRQTPTSAFKTSNSLPYVLAGIFGRPLRRMADTRCAPLERSRRTSCHHRFLYQNIQKQQPKLNAE